MGLLRMAARTAVVAGTATAVSGRVARGRPADTSMTTVQPAEPEPAPQARIRTRRGRTTRGRSVRQGAAAGLAALVRVCSPTTSSPRPRPRRWGSDRATVAVTVDEAEPYTRLAAVYDEIVVDPCHRAWASYLHDLWAGDPAQVHSVLDLGCGTGLMAAALTAYGYRVTGVDPSAAMLARARRLLGPEAVLLQRTMPGLGVDGVFDAVISTFDALNYLPTSELGATVAAVARRLRPGAGWSSTCTPPRC